MKKTYNYIVFFIGLAVFTAGLIAFSTQSQATYGQEFAGLEKSFISPENSLVVKAPQKEAAKRIKVVITAYSSCPYETDSTPFITANGSEVKEGIVANNLLPFGTEIRIPELYGNKVFVVEDRMNAKKGYYHVDIWFPSKEQAVKFGSFRTYIEVLES
ncbi:MAG: hypothetical protein WC410_01065 [Candidatus Paceibacterota bacterium]|nr:hypothetical protein [Candidatus Paceibacterota bacterium]MDD5555376.1 hypothetical protein [Candidatus Paceibacterota bacterium]